MFRIVTLNLRCYLFVAFCLISPDVATFSLALHKHVFSIVKRLITSASLALSTLSPIFCCCVVPEMSWLSTCPLHVGGYFVAVDNDHCNINLFGWYVFSRKSKFRSGKFVFIHKVHFRQKKISICKVMLICQIFIESENNFSLLDLIVFPYRPESHCSEH